MVIKNLGARAARTGITHLPEVIRGIRGALVIADAHNPVSRHTNLFGPDIVGFIIGGIDSDQQFFLWQLQHRGQKSPGKQNGVALEVIAKAEVTQHLEKGMVSGRIANIIQIVVLATCPDTALGGCCPAVGAEIRAKENILELVHPCVGEQKSGIVVRNQRAGCHNLVPLGAEKLEKRLADLCGGHVHEITCLLQKWGGLYYLTA